MSEPSVLALVDRFPHRTALARRAGDGVFAVLARLQRSGHVVPLGTGYRLTLRGRQELELCRALARLAARSRAGYGI